MKRRDTLALGLGAVGASLVKGAPAASDAAVRRWTGAPAAPPLELRTLDDQVVGLASLAGRVVLVNFWATWCEPCVDELPSLQRLRDRLSTASFEILAVNYMESEPRIRAFLQRVPIRFPVLRDSDGATAKAWGARIFPASYLVDARGRRRFAVTGGLDWTGPSAAAALRELLAQAAGAR